MRTQMIIFFLLITMLSALSAQNGYYIESKTHSDGVMGQPARDGIEKVWNSGNKMRIESEGSVMILDGEKRVTYNMMPQKKQFFVFTYDEMRQMMKMTGRLMQKGLEFTSKKTGETKKINKWDTYEVVIESPMMKQSLWFTEDIDYDKKDFFEVYKDMPEVEQIAEQVMNLEDVDGYPVFVETTMNMMGMTIRSTSELIRIEKKSVSPEKFSLPPDYKEVDNPMKQMLKNMPKHGGN